MSDTIRSLQNRTKAPQRLIEAVQNGERYERAPSNGSSDSPRKHLRRFSLALAAYACVAALIVGGVYLVPLILGEDDPVVTQPNPPVTTDPPDRTDPSDQPYSPEALYRALLDAEEASLTIIEPDPAGTYTFVHSIDGPIYKQESYYDGEIRDITYYDYDEGLLYYSFAAGQWVTDTPDSPFNWETEVEDDLPAEFFEDDCYEKTDNGYRFSDEALAAYCDEEGHDGDFEVTITIEEQRYTLSISLSGDSRQSDFERIWVIDFAPLNLKLPGYEDEESFVDGLAYAENEDGGYTVVGLGDCLDTHIVIPSTVNGKPVTAIADEAFYADIGLFGLTIPSSVKTIGARAFAECQLLTEVNIAEGVETIGAGAFYGCRSLERVTIPGSVKNFGDEAFSHCNALIYAEIGEGVTKIGESAFYYCNSLMGVTLPRSLTKIGDWAFVGCENLGAINLRDSLTYIGIRAFADCTRLNEVIIPASVTEIGVCAFSGCTYLMRLVVDEGNGVYYSAGNCLIERESGAILAGCMTSVIPDDGSVKAIGAYAFYRMPFTSFVIPEGVTEIGVYAFSSCEQLAEIVLPDSLTVIDEGAFAECYSLERVVIPSGVEMIGGSAFVCCSSLTGVTISEGVEIIGESAFAECYSLSSVTIPAGVRRVVQNAFIGCDALAELHFVEPDGWTVYDEQIDLSDPAHAASLFKGEYYGSETWYRE